jgi:hypothetical protein
LLASPGAVLPFTTRVVTDEAGTSIRALSSVTATGVPDTRAPVALVTIGVTVAPSATRANFDRSSFTVFAAVASLT